MKRPYEADTSHSEVAATTADVAAEKLVAQILSQDGLTVDDVAVGGRPRSPFTGTMGNHSTAFVVQVGAIRRAIITKQAGDAAGAIGQLVAQVRELPGYGLIRRLPEKQRDNLRVAEERIVEKCADAEQMGLLDLQDMIRDFLQFRELVPLTVINVRAVAQSDSGKGNAEGEHHETLRHSEENYEPIPPDNLKLAIIGLLDVKALAYILTATPGDRERILPGSTEIRPEDLKLMIVQQHIFSVTMDCPNAFGKAWPGVAATPEKLPEIIIRAIDPAIEEQREKVLNACLARLADWDRRASPGLYEERRSSAYRNELVAQIEQIGGTPPSAPTGLGRREVRKPERFRETHEQPTAKPATKQPGHCNKLPVESAPIWAKEQVEGRRRQRLTTQVRIDKRGRIIGLDSSGRSPSPFPGAIGMGGHTTAWIVYIDLVRTTIISKTAQEAFTALQRIASAADRQKMPFKRHVDADGKDLARIALEQFVGHGSRLAEIGRKQPPESRYQLEGIVLQEAINSLFTFFNYLPGATLQSGNINGASEGRKRKLLKGHESAESPRPKGLLQRSLLGLLDLRGVQQQERRLALMDRHRWAVEQAYPKCWQDSGMKEKNASELLKMSPETKEDETCPPLKKRRTMDDAPPSSPV
ncbi:hypothetical protein ACFUYE_01680 [Micromonospora humida]|uniref:hypothetical protein n=1 Tax=Micromonospora humida TaxID=2809018 RepID=UPI00366DE3EB